MVEERSPFPEGAEYWGLTRRLEDDCERETLTSAIADSELAERLGTVTSLLYRMASCYWGCHGKEHVFEYLSGRTCTSAHSAFRLFSFGYYDEALALTRNIAEIGNLTQLFFADNSHIRGWLDATDKERKTKYSPVQVRRSLEALGSVIPTDQDRYSWLCEIGTHITPKTLPQAHNLEKQPILGSLFQCDGFKTALNGLAWSVCTVSGPMAKIAILERQSAERLFEETMALAHLLFAEPDAPLSQ